MTAYDKDTSRPWLIIPMEIVERELLGKLLVCAEATKRDWGCIIGTKKAILQNAECLPKGTMLLKSIIISELPYMRNYREMGFDLICLDEEGLIQNSLEHMVEMRSQPETMAELERFMLWGNIQYNTFKRKMPDFANKYRVVGNPRIDTWSKSLHGLYAEEVKNIKDKFGNYIILPTSFAMYNHFMGFDGAIEIYKVDNMMNEDDYQFQLGYRDYVKEIYEGFLELMPKVCQAFPDHNIVIRPHPSENRKPWDELAERFDNMYVEYEGGVSAWLLGSDVVLHCGSTTAVEGHIMGKPVISYCPCSKEDQEKFDLEVPAKASILLYDQDQVLDMIGQILKEGEQFTHEKIAQGHEELKEWIYGLDDENSVVHVMDVIEQVGAKKCETFSFGPKEHRPKVTKKEVVWRFLDILCQPDFILRLMPERIKHGIRSRRYGRHKIRDLREHDIQHYIAQISELKGQEAPEIRYLQDNLFQLSPREKGAGSA